MHTHMDFQTFLGPCVRYYTALLILLHYKEANTYSTVNIQYIQSKYSSSTLAPFGQCMVMVKAEGVQSMLLLIPANVHSYPDKHNLFRHSRTYRSTHCDAV